ncbi:MAG: DUF4384 domain-containing protein, partial [bacterium]|nr:DUF4384 domain-containing protein [bacterium]
NVHLDLSGDSGFLLLGERFDVTVESDLPAYLLLLNVDTTGAVTVLYPIARDELRARTFMREKHEVNPPLGTEYLKLFAFRERPAGLERWIDQKLDVTDPRFEELLRFLRSPHRDGAQTRLKVVTVKGLVRPPDAWPSQ